MLLALKSILLFCLDSFLTLNYSSFKQQKGNKIYKLQSSQVKHIIIIIIYYLLFIIWKLNQLVVVDFRFISAFLHA